MFMLARYARISVSEVTVWNTDVAEGVQTL